MQASSFFSILLAAATLLACDKAPPPASPPPPEVLVQTIAPKTMPLAIDIVTELKAFREVELRPRVTGLVIRQNFREGQKVKEGDLLFVIDPRSLDEAVIDAKAKLAESEAVLARSRQDVERYKPLLPDNAIPRQTYDQAVAAEQQSMAVVQARRSGVAQARIDRSYAEVRSPISGSIGLQQVEVGSMATAGQTVLATVSTLDPVFAYFSVSETDYLKFARGRISGEKQVHVPIELILADGGTHSQSGEIDFSDPAISAGTNTWTLRAIFPNADGLLRPGMNARVRITYAVVDNAIAIPQKAVTELLGKEFVTVIGAGDIAEQRSIRSGPRVGATWVINEGLKPGERIVIEGLQKARPGTQVKPVVVNTPATMQKH